LQFLKKLQKHKKITNIHEKNNLDHLVLPRRKRDIFKNTDKNKNYKFLNLHVL